jgi:hypothetical protein
MAFLTRAARRAVVALAGLTGLLASGCLHVDAEGFPCSIDDKCPAGLTCHKGSCHAMPPSDGGIEASPPDTGLPLPPDMNIADMEQPNKGCTATGCPAGSFCNASGACEDKRALGRACAEDRECLDVCAKEDGVCCKSACTGQCQTCKTADNVCKTITGQPQAPRLPCPGDSACGGSCDGQNIACVFPPLEKICRPKRCERDLSSLATNPSYFETVEARCDQADHNCPALTTNGCKGYACDALMLECRHRCSTLPMEGCPTGSVCCPSPACDYLTERNCNVCKTSCS